jgi:chromosome partitioning protein
MTKAKLKPHIRNLGVCQSGRMTDYRSLLPSSRRDRPQHPPAALPRHKRPAKLDMSKIRFLGLDTQVEPLLQRELPIERSLRLPDLATRVVDRCRVLLVSSPKGGSGKSVLSRHLLVSASQAGVSAIGLDCDRQQTLAKWAARRTQTRQTFPDFADVLVEPVSLQNWRGALSRTQRYKLAIIDTPPSVEDHLPSIEALSDAADLVLIPAICTQDDVDSVAPWVKALNLRGCRSSVVLNRANRRTTSYARMRGIFVRAGSVCPTELPQLEDVHMPATRGLTLLDYSKSRGIAPFEEIWAYVRREIGL